MIPSKRQGFGFIELIITIVITLVVVGIASRLLSSGYTSYARAQTISALNDVGSIALTRMSRELTSAIGMSTIGASTVTFTSATGSTVTYALSGTNLTRTENAGAPQTLATPVRSLSFGYYDTNLAVTTTPTAVQGMTINLSLAGANSNLALINAIFLENQ